MTVAETVTGISLDAVATLAGAVGKMMLRQAAVSGNYWWYPVGLFFTALIDPVFDVAAYSYAAGSVITACAGLVIVWTVGYAFLQGGGYHNTQLKTTTRTLRYRGRHAVCPAPTPTQTAKAPGRPSDVTRNAWRVIAQYILCIWNFTCWPFSLLLLPTPV